MNCSIGIHKIGFVMVVFGTVNALASMSIGHIARHVKRYPIVVAGALFNAGLLMVLLWWKPSSSDLPMFYVISGCLGLCDAIWTTQTNSKKVEEIYGKCISCMCLYSYKCHKSKYFNKTYISISFVN